MLAFDALLLGGERECIGVLLLAIDIAAQAELAAERDGLLDETALFTAPVGAAADLVALVADDGIGQQAGLLRVPGALGNGGLRGAEGWVVDMGGGKQHVQTQRRAACGAGQRVGLGGWLLSGGIG